MRTIRKSLVLACWAMAAAAPAAGIVIIDDRESGTQGAPGGPQYLEWTAVSNFPQPTVNFYNATAPLRGTHDVLVSGDTATVANPYTIKKQYPGGALPGTFGNGLTYMGARVQRQSFAWNFQIGFNCAQQNAGFASPAMTIAAGTGYVDAVWQVTNSWAVVAGSPTNGAQFYVQNYGIVGTSLTADVPPAAGVFSMQFDEIVFTDAANQNLPVSVSRFETD